MMYLELYLKADIGDIINFIKKKSEELDLEITLSESENHIRIRSGRRAFKDSLKILFWKSSKKYPPNYTLLDIIMFKPYEDITQVILRINDVFKEIGLSYYNDLLDKYIPYHKWREFKELSTP